jgi:hypothetical protein
MKLLLSFSFIFILVISLDVIQAEQNDCSKAQSLKIRSEFNRLYNNKEFQQAEKHLFKYISDCDKDLFSGAVPDQLVAWLYSDLMLVKQKVGDIKGCIEQGLLYNHRSSYGNETGELEKAKKAINYNLNNCRSDISSLIDLKFNSEPCTASGYPRAIKILNLPFDKEENIICLGITSGTTLTADEFAELPEDVDTKKFAPYVYLVKDLGNSKVAEKKMVFLDGDISEGSHCGELDIKATNHDGVTYIHLSGELSYCWPGSASFGYDSVYKLSGDGILELIHEVLVGMD